MLPGKSYEISDKLERTKKMILYKSISETEGNMSFVHKELKVTFLAPYSKINL